MAFPQAVTELFHAAFDAMQLGVTLSDPVGRFVYVNESAAAMHGYTPDELIGKPAHVLGAPSARQTLSMKALRDVKRWKRETLNVRKDGDTFPVLLRSDVLEDADGRTIGIVTVCEDLTERKRQEEEEARRALRDALTGLASRNFFLHLVERVLQRRLRHPEQRFAVLYVDIDRFQLINESLGHEAGDALLINVAERILTTLRPSDLVARIAGDEFAILVDDINDASDGTRVAERVIDAMRAPLRIADRDLYVTPSIGIALSDSNHERAEQYLADATAAMKRAHARGEGNYEIFDRTVHRRATARLRLETDLRRAIDQEELRVLYQPIVELQSGGVAGFEALVRWNQEGRGLVSPGEFIPVAEETGLIVPIGTWILRAACSQVAEWRRRFPTLAPLTINVNFSARHLSQPTIFQDVQAVLRETGLPPGNLKVEITETMLMEAQAQRDILQEFRDAGVGIAIDDFGTGYSSLSYLRRFSVDSLKIDRSFLAETGTGKDGWDIVEMIIRLARDLGVSVVAEGVETEEQRERLRAAGCHRAQGYYFARPLAAEDAERLLAEQAATAP